MAITTLDGVIAGMQATVPYMKVASGTTVAGRAWTHWNFNGSPGAGALDTTLDGVALSAPITGQIYRQNPSSGNAYLARLTAACTQATLLMLCDRLWHNGGINITSSSPQTITSPTWPARDINGSTDGEGVMLAVEVNANTGAGTPTISISYINSTNTGGTRTATNIVATIATSAKGSVYLMALQAGDTGVRSVSGITLSSTWTSGTINIVAYRILTALELAGNLVPNAIDALTGGMPRIYDDSVLYTMFIPVSTSSSTLSMTYTETQG